MVGTGIVGVDASPTLPQDRDAVHVELYVVGISNNRAERSQAPVYAEYLCSCGGGGGREAQLGQGAIDVPMMETSQDVAPSEEAEREQLRTLLANLDASIAALTLVAAGDEDVCQILQAKQEKRKPLKTRLRAAQEAHEKANMKYTALVEEEEESVMRELREMHRVRGILQPGHLHL